MRWKIISLLMAAMVALSAAQSAWAQNKGKGFRKKEDPNAAKIDLAVNKVFESADKNRSGTLSEREFKNAHSMLDTAVRELARSGAIGQGKKRPSEDHGAPVMSIDLSKNKRITPAEFSFYAQRIIASADEKFRAARQAYESQQRSAAKKRQAAAKRGKR